MYLKYRLQHSSHFIRDGIWCINIFSLARSVDSGILMKNISLVFLLIDT